MKLRINGNSLRLRLTPKEVEQISQGQTVDCFCLLPQGKLTYRLVVGEDWNVSARVNQIDIAIPSALCQDWAKSEQVEFEKHFDTGLFLLIEKDFQCLKPRAHENEDHLYPNPEKID